MLACTGTETLRGCGTGHIIGEDVNVNSIGRSHVKTTPRSKNTLAGETGESKRAVPPLAAAGT